MEYRTLFFVWQILYQEICHEPAEVETPQRWNWKSGRRQTSNAHTHIH